MWRSFSSCAVIVATLAAPSIARADDAADADQLFREANELVARGRYEEACPKLAESQRIEPAVGTQFNLADCYEHVGRTATAFALFTDVARIARAAGKFERERIAKERAAALEPRLARLHLVVRAPAPGLEIKIDDVTVPAEKRSAAFPIDPGAHRIVASAPSRTSWEGTATPVEGKTVEVVVPELVDPNPPPPLVVTRAAPAWSTQRTIAIAVAGAGVAGIAVGAIAGAMSLSARNLAEEACPSATYDFRCPTVQGTDDWNSATTAGNVATVGFIVGGAALAGAAVLWFTAPSSKEPSPKVRAGVSTTGLRVEGTF